MRTFLLAIALIAATAGTAAAQPAIITTDSLEAFPGVWYEGGHSAHPRRQLGVLVLTDSTLAFHACYDATYCPVSRRRPMPHRPEPVFVVHLRQLTEVAASTRTLSPGVGRRIMWGVLANDRNQEVFAFAYDGERTAEAPVFVTRPAQAGAIDAKVRFRLRRLGLPDLRAASDSQP